MLKNSPFVCAAAAAAMLGAGAAAQAQTQVVFWQFSTRDAYVQAWNDAIAAFEAENPDIDVVMEIVPWSEQQQRLVSALASGGLPDVSMLGNNVVAQFQAIGALAPLDDYFAAYSEAHGYDVGDDIWPGDRGYYNLAGSWWASPWLSKPAPSTTAGTCLSKRGSTPMRRRRPGWSCSAPPPRLPRRPAATSMAGPRR